MSHDPQQNKGERMTTVLIPTALLSLDDLPTEERISLGLPNWSDDLTRVKINEASDWIEQETSNAFVIRAITNERQLISGADANKPTAFPVMPVASDFRWPLIFTDFRPIKSVEKIVQPDGTEFDLTKISIDPRGKIFGMFTITYDANGFPLSHSVDYTAGTYQDTASVPPALKHACKLVLQWAWKVNVQMERGDYVPMMIHEALTGFYSFGGSVWG